MTPQHRWIACVALAKICMPKLAELYLRFKENNEVFVDETVEAALSAHAVATKLKYECPPSSLAKICRIGRPQRAVSCMNYFDVRNLSWSNGPLYYSRTFISHNQ
jgi:hypothetical protein